MDIVQKFIKASLKEANRSEASIIYNNNLSYYEKLAIILAKRLNGKILKKRKYDFSIAFDLPQNYSLKVSQCDAYYSSYVSLNKNNIEIFDKDLSFFKGDNLESYSDTINEYAKIYKVPVEVLTKVFEYILKVKSIISTFNSQTSLKGQAKIYRKSTIARQKLEQYKKDYGYYRDLFVKSGAISKEDLAKYTISIEPEECGEPDWDLDLDYSGSAKFDSKITFNFRDRTTKALYKFVYNVSFTVGVDGWYSPGDYWDPPEGEEWLTGDIYNGEVEADLLDVKVDGPSNGELEDHLADIIDDFANSGMLAQYINDNLEDITGYNVK